MMVETSLLTDINGQSHEIQLFQQWDISFYMLGEAKLWIPAIENDSWEKEQRDFFFTEIRSRGATVGIDIGANNGIYSLLMCKDNELKKVIAFEPCEPHFSMMRKAVNMSGYAKRCEMHRLACSATSDKRVMYIFPDSTPSLNQFAETKVKTDHEIENLKAKTELVTCISLDEQLDFNDMRIAIKIDTEGHEQQVIYGARRLLVENRCFLQVESFDGAVVQQLKTLGYLLIHKIHNDWYFDKECL